MLVTIYTDGGIKKNQNVWAFIAKSHYGAIEGKGEVTGKLSIEHVEYEAVRRAAAGVYNQWPDVKCLFFNIDNLAVVNAFWIAAGIRSYGASQYLINKATAMIKYFKERGIEIRVKKVKAHQSGNGIRGYMNNKVDKAVRSVYVKN